MNKKIDTRHVVKLNDSNYQHWKFQIEIVLRAAGLWEIVNGDTPRPTADAEQAAWDEKDVWAQSIIVPNVGKNQTYHIFNCRTSQEIYARLKDPNSDASTLNKQHTLSKFFNYKISPEQSILQAYREIEELARNLNEMGVVMNDTNVVTKIVLCLPDEKYHAFKKALDSVQEASQTMPIFLSKLKKEELENKNCEKKPKERKAAAYSSGVTRTQSSSNSKDDKDLKGNRITELKKRTKCHYCSKLGHWKSECRKKEQEEQQGESRQNDGISSHSSLRNDNRSQRGPRSANQSGSNERSDGPLAFMIRSDEEDEKRMVWISDSGASKHITGQKTWFESYTPFENPLIVSLTDQHKAKAVGTAVVCLEALIGNEWKICKISNVLLIPGAVNLFSEGSNGNEGLQNHSR